MNASSFRKAPPSPSCDLPTDDQPGPFRRVHLLVLAAALVCQMALLGVAAVANRGAINPDAIGYIRIADHVLHWRPNLMISGYWGPLLSWLIAPLLPLVADPLHAARIVMALTAVVFVAGAIAVFRSLRLPPLCVVIGTWLTALFSVYHSVATITPDLLVAGLLCAALARLMSDRWLERPATSLGAGLLFGAAYLAKAVALPLAVMALPVLGAAWLYCQRASWSRVGRAGLLTVLGALLVAGPWVLVLSLKYGQPVFSTSARIAHAVVGPSDVPRSHPHVRTLHQPEPGRLDSWEDPSHMDYAYWSPLDSPEYAAHQIMLVVTNWNLAINCLFGFDRTNLWVFALVAGLVFHRPWRRNMQTQRWRWAGVPVLLLTMLYLPVYSEERYYLPAYPFLVAASLGMVLWLTGRMGRCRRLWRSALLAVIVVSLGAIRLPEALRSLASPDACHARTLAERLTAAGIRGPVATSPTAAYVGKYLAFFIESAWHGVAPPRRPAMLRSANARLCVVARGSAFDSALAADTAFVDLDAELALGGADGPSVPYRVYEVREAPAATQGR